MSRCIFQLANNTPQKHWMSITWLISNFKLRMLVRIRICLKSWHRNSSDKMNWLNFPQLQTNHFSEVSVLADNLHPHEIFWTSIQKKKKNRKKKWKRKHFLDKKMQIIRMTWVSLVQEDHSRYWIYWGRYSLPVLNWLLMILTERAISQTANPSEKLHLFQISSTEVQMSTSYIWWNLPHICCCMSQLDLFFFG